MSAASVLSSALSLIAAPNRWTRQAVATDATGKEMPAADERARRFDMIGAIQRVESSSDDYGQAIRFLRKQCGRKSIFEFNDSHGHRAVLKCMRRAIAEAEREGA